MSKIKRENRDEDVMPMLRAIARLYIDGEARIGTNRYEQNLDDLYETFERIVWDARRLTGVLPDDLDKEDGDGAPHA